MDMLALFQCLRPHVTATTLRPFSRITRALLAIPGRITMLGLARWAGQGGSYRTGPRCCSTVIPWAMLCGVFFRQHVHCAAQVYLLAGDDVVVTKAGKHTDGRDRFFASLYGKPGPGVSFLALSRVSVQARRSFPLRVEPVVRSAAAKAASQANKPPPPATAQGHPGRPQGRKNQDKAAVTLTPEL